MPTLYDDCVRWIARLCSENLEPLGHRHRPLPGMVRADLGPATLVDATADGLHGGPDRTRRGRRGYRGHARRVGHAPPRVREYPGRLASTSLTVPAHPADHLVELGTAALRIHTKQEDGDRPTWTSTPRRRGLHGRPQRDMVTVWRAFADRHRAVLVFALILAATHHDIARDF